MEVHLNSEEMQRFVLPFFVSQQKDVRSIFDPSFRSKARFNNFDRYRKNFSFGSEYSPGSHWHAIFHDHRFKGYPEQLSDFRNTFVLCENSIDRIYDVTALAGHSDFKFYRFDTNSLIKYDPEHVYDNVYRIFAIFCEYNLDIRDHVILMIDDFKHLLDVEPKLFEFFKSFVSNIKQHFVYLMLGCSIWEYAESIADNISRDDFDFIGDQVDDGGLPDIQILVNNN